MRPSRKPNSTCGCYDDSCTLPITEQATKCSICQSQTRKLMCNRWYCSHCGPKKKEDNLSDGLENQEIIHNGRGATSNEIDKR